jgi:AcrR family transcriptional regulator
VIAQATELPVLGGEALERADAARNRARILCAAERLFGERGVENVSMEAIAEAAGVGKGTLFRRFGDRVGLAHALLDSHERELQEQLIRGEPPLGPGAPAVDRIVAFGLRLLEHLEANGDLLLAAETGAPWVRFTAPAYTFYRTHLVMLVRDAAPDCDPGYLADALLAPLAADLYLYLRRVRGLSLEQIAAGWEQLARSSVS